MKRVDVVRAWKDAEYRNSLSEAERAALPANPVEALPLSDDELRGVAGGTLGGWTFSGGYNTQVAGCCRLK